MDFKINVFIIQKKKYLVFYFYLKDFELSHSKF